MRPPVAAGPMSRKCNASNGECVAGVCECAGANATSTASAMMALRMTAERITTRRDSAALWLPGRRRIVGLCERVPRRDLHVLGMRQGGIEHRAFVTAEAGKRNL